MTPALTLREKMKGRRPRNESMIGRAQDFDVKVVQALLQLTREEPISACRATLVALLAPWVDQPAVRLPCRLVADHGRVIRPVGGRRRGVGLPDESVAGRTERVTITDKLRRSPALFAALLFLRQSGRPALLRRQAPAGVGVCNPSVQSLFRDSAWWSGPFGVPFGVPFGGPSFLHTLRGFPLLEVVPCGTIEFSVLAF